MFRKFGFTLFQFTIYAYFHFIKTLEVGFEPTTERLTAASSTIELL